MTNEQSASSKREALKSTSIIGGASGIVMVIRMVRTKVLAVLLGPAGIGLEGIYDSVLTVVRTVFDLGMSGSGVRQIAAATGSGDPQRVATTVVALRRICLLLGGAGALALFAGREWASRAAFGDTSHATAFGWLSLAVFAAVVSGAYGALLQGMRRIADMARMNIIGAALGAVVSIPIVFVWGQAGVPAYMIVAAVVALVVAVHYTRKVTIQPTTLTVSEAVREARGLLTLGLAFMATALIAAAAPFLVRAIVIRQFGLEGAGQFQAASALSMVYVGFVLQAMGTDFYPRLTAAAADDARANRLVNEQAEVSLLLALPGILGTMAFAPWVIRIFYTGSFAVAADILVWQMGGMLLRVMSWPLGFMALAKGRSAIFFWTDIAAWSAYIALAWLGLDWFGLQGAGMAFLGLYVFHVGMMYGVVRRLSGFRWNPHYLRYAAASLAAAMLVLWVRLRWPEPWATLLPCLAAAAAGVYSLHLLVRIAELERIERALVRLRLGWLLRLAGRGRAQ